MAHRTRTHPNLVLVLAIVCCLSGRSGLDAGAANAAPTTCAQAAADSLIPADVPVLDWAENLGYDRTGALWVSRLHRDEVQRYEDGRLTATVRVDSPGAVRLGPDGLLYVVYGVSQFRRMPGGVVRFDPAASEPRPEILASGLTFPNGADFDDDGRLYVATAAGIVRIGPDGVIDSDWSEHARFNGNGVVVRDDNVFVTSNGDPFGRVLRFPADDPAARTVVADLPSPVPGVPDFADDLTIDDTGDLYVTTLSGQLLRVGQDGASCSVLSTEPLTAVAAIPDRRGEFVAGTERGEVLHIHLAE